MQKRRLSRGLLVIILTSFFFALIRPLPVGAQILTSITSITPTSGNVGTTVRLIGTIDTEGGAYSIRFDIYGDNEPFEPEELVETGVVPAASITVDTTFVVPSCVGSDAGNGHSVVLHDNATLNSQQTSFVVITSRVINVPSHAKTGDEIPITITVTGGAPSTFYNYTAVVTDPSASTFMDSFSFTSDANGEGAISRNYPSTFSSGAHTNIAGSYSVIINQVAPSAIGTAASASFLIEEENQRPTAFIDSIEPGSSTFGDVVTFTGSGSDRDGEIIDYMWTSNIDGLLSTSATFSTSNLSVGNHTILFRVQDNDLAWSDPILHSSIIQIVDNQPPSISIPTWNPETPVENEEVKVQFSVSDEASDITTVTFWYRVSGGEWEELPLELDGETWIATIPGQERRMSVDFYIVCSDSFGNSTETGIFSYNVRAPSDSPDLLLPAVIIGSSAATIGSIAAYRVYYQGRPSSSDKIGKKAEQKRRKEEEKQDKENKKRELRSKKGKPYLDVKIDVPLNIIGARSYETKVNIINKGLATAKDIQIKVASTPGLMLSKEIENISELQPHEEKPPIIFPFKASEQMKKGIYILQFEIRSKQTQPRIYKRFLRALKIGLLFDPKKPEFADPLQNWLRKQNYTWDQLVKADDFLRLLQYDLLILAPELEGLQEKDINNISNFVENGQSLLTIDKITSPAQEVIAKTLGYHSIQYETFKSMEGALTITNNQHSITKGFAVGEKIPLGTSWGNACTSKTSGQIIAVQAIKTKNRRLLITPAIMVNRYGRGKTLHLNFHAENSIPQIDNILKNSVNWLLSA